MATKQMSERLKINVKFDTLKSAIHQYGNPRGLPAHSNNLYRPGNRISIPRTSASRLPPSHPAPMTRRCSSKIANPRAARAGEPPPADCWAKETAGRN